MCRWTPISIREISERVSVVCITAVTTALTELACLKAKIELVAREVVRKGEMIQAAQQVSLMSFQVIALKALSPSLLESVMYVMSLLLHLVAVVQYIPCCT